MQDDIHAIGYLFNHAVLLPCILACKPACLLASRLRCFRRIRVVSYRPVQTLEGPCASPRSETRPIDPLAWTSRGIEVLKPPRASRTDSGLGAGAPCDRELVADSEATHRRGGVLEKSEGDLRQTATGNRDRALPGFQTGFAGNRGSRLPGFETGFTGIRDRKIVANPRRLWRIWTITLNSVLKPQKNSNPPGVLLTGKETNLGSTGAHRRGFDATEEQRWTR